MAGVLDGTFTDAERDAWLADPARTAEELEEVAKTVLLGWRLHEEWVRRETSSSLNWFTDEALAMLTGVLHNPSVDERQAVAWWKTFHRLIEQANYAAHLETRHWLQAGEALASNPALPLWQLTGSADAVAQAAIAMGQESFIPFDSLSQDEAQEFARRTCALAETLVQDAEELRRFRHHRSQVEAILRGHDFVGYPESQDLNQALNMAWWPLKADLERRPEGAAQRFLLLWLVASFFDEGSSPWLYPALRDLMIERSGRAWPLLADGSAWKRTI